MVHLVAFGKSLRVAFLGLGPLVLCAMALIASSLTPVSARSHHHFSRVYRHHFTHRAAHHGSRYRRMTQSAPGDAGVAQMQTQGFSGTSGSFVQNPVSPAIPPSTGYGSSDVVAEARRYIGGNPTGKSRLWCASFMNLVLERSGHHGSGSNMARSFASYGRRISGPQVGAIAVMSRNGGGHVGVVSGIDASGNPIIVSGNHDHRVAESPYPRGRIYAYVMPTG